MGAVRRAAGVAVAGLMAIVGGTSTASAGSGTNYVALGDSYSSGVGAGSYTTESGACDRSTNSYPYLWAAAHSPASFKSVACSGATTSTVINSQLSALTSSTTLVSISVGGNDEGFASIMSDCVLWGTTTCVKEVNAAKADATANLPAKLASVYSGIKSRSPQAHVVVLGYPDFYDLSVSFCVGLSSTSRAAINSGIDTVNSVTKTAATSAGFTFADVRPAFVGHEICDGSKSWLHSTEITDITSSYHPTAAGQSGGYLPAFTAAN